MAVGNVVPAKKGVKLALIRCWKCDTLYSTDDTRRTYFEGCPVCGYKFNNAETVIPAWKFKLIRWWRERKRKCD